MLVSAQILPGCVQYSDFSTDFRSIVSAITLHGSMVGENTETEHTTIIGSPFTRARRSSSRPE